MTIKKDRSPNMSKINKSIFTYYSQTCRNDEIKTKKI